MSKDEKKVVSDTERINLRRQGTSDVLTFPRIWRRTFRFFKVEPLVFDAHVELDENGVPMIVLKKVKPCDTSK